MLYLMIVAVLGLLCIPELDREKLYKRFHFLGRYKVIPIVTALLGFAVIAKFFIMAL